MKKLFALLIALVLVASCCFTATADDELPEGAFVLDFAGFQYEDGRADILYSADETTIEEFTGKDLNYFAVAIVDAETMEVTWFMHDPLGRPDGVKSDILVPANSYLIILHGNNAGYAAFNPEVGDEVVLYNVDVDAAADLANPTALTNSGFTYAKPEELVLIDVDTTGWTNVDGETVGAWQNTGDPVGTYCYNAGIKDGKYVMEIVFNGDLSGTNDSYGNGNGTNVRVWFHTAKNEAGTDQLTYNSFIDVAYTPDGVINRFMVNGSADGNSAAAKYGYEDKKPYTIETVVPTALDGLYVKLVFDDIPNCDINEDLEAIFTVSNKPGDLANNALYSGSFLKPYSSWESAEAFGFYESGDEPEEPSEEPSKEESKEQSKEESKPVTPKTGDNGMIALAIVSVITLAGVVVVKKSK